MPRHSVHRDRVTTPPPPGGGNGFRTDRRKLAPHLARRVLRLVALGLLTAVRLRASHGTGGAGLHHGGSAGRRWDAESRRCLSCRRELPLRGNNSVNRRNQDDRLFLDDDVLGIYTHRYPKGQVIQ